MTEQTDRMGMRVPAKLAAKVKETAAEMDGDDTDRIAKIGVGPLAAEAKSQKEKVE